MNATRVGTIAALYRFPVKSMRGERLEQANIYWHGLEGDRRYAFVRSGNLTRFPWLTGREVPDLLRYAPYLLDEMNPRECAVRVHTPDGGDLPVESDTLRDTLAAAYGAPVHLLHCGRGTFDSAPLSLVGLASVRDLGALLGQDLDPVRFRQNIVVEPDGGAFAEEAWLGRALSFGAGPDAPRIRLIRRDERCMMINLDPETAAQTPAVLREVVRTRDNCFGLYAQPERLGPVRAGDAVYLHDE